MNKLFDDAIAALGTVIATPLAQGILSIGWACLLILWIAAAAWAFRDAGLRVDNQLAPAGVAVLVLAATPLAFPLGIVVYRLVRPQETLADASERRLALATLEAAADQDRCPACDARTDESWVRCPACGTTLRIPCPHCSSLVEPAWTICPWCVAELSASPDSRPVVWPVPTVEAADRSPIRRILGVLPRSAASSAPAGPAPRRSAGRARRLRGLPNPQAAAGRPAQG